MPLEMRARNEQPLIAIQLAEDRMGEEILSQPGIRRRRELHGAPAGGFELSKQLLVAPLSGWLHKLRRLKPGIALYHDFHQGFLSSFPGASLGWIGRSSQHLFDPGVKHSILSDGQ